MKNIDFDYLMRNTNYLQKKRVKPIYFKNKKSQMENIDIIKRNEDDNKISNNSNINQNINYTNYINDENSSKIL